MMGTAGRSLMDIQKDEEARAAARAAARPVTSDVRSPALGRAGHWGAAAGPAVKSGQAPFLLHPLVKLLFDVCSAAGLAVEPGCAGNLPHPRSGCFEMSVALFVKAKV